MYTFGLPGSPIEESVRKQLLLHIKEFQSASDQVTVTLEDERRILCIGYLGNYAAFGIDVSGAIAIKYMVEQNHPDSSFSFHPYVGAIKTLLNEYVVRGDSVKRVSSPTKTKRRRTRKGTVKNVR